MSKDSGFLVTTKNGKKGRTYHSKGNINGKTPVYLEEKPFIYSDKAILCETTTLKIIGFID